MKIIMICRNIEIMAKKFCQLIICLMLTAQFLSSCNNQVVTKSPEDEIVDYILKSIIDVNNLHGRHLIVYGPTITTMPDVFYVSKKSPYQIWWVENGKLIEMGNDTKAITDFYKISEQDDLSWEIGFSIISINDNSTSAKVYVEKLCGTTCGTGMMLYLQRADSRQWEIEKEEELWIS